MDEDKYVKDLKAYYMSPAVEEIEWRDYFPWSPEKYKGTLFEVHTRIWLDTNMPSYRHAVPESMSFAEQNEAFRNYDAIETRFVEYRPTGRVLYDNRLPPARALLWEYRLHNSRDMVQP